MPDWQASYAEAALRCFQDGNTLYGQQRYPNASHLFGLAAECALKVLLSNLPGVDEAPHTHLPQLRDDVLRMLSRRSNNGVRQLVGKSNYMDQWDIANRYWPAEAFGKTSCEIHRNHSRRTLYATGVWSTL